MSTMIERVAEAISSVALWSRINDWATDRVEGLPIEICRYGNDGEPDIVVVRRFPRGTGEIEALTLTVSAERARAAIEAVADWMDDQRKDVPTHGWEFATALRQEAAN